MLKIIMRLDYKLREIITDNTLFYKKFTNFLVNFKNTYYYFLFFTAILSIK